MEALTAADLAGLAGVTEAEIGRMVALGVLVPREGAAPFLAGDMQKVRLAMACERAGLPMDAIAAAIRAGRLSFAFLEAAPYQRWAQPSDRTFRQVSEETGIDLDTLREAARKRGWEIRDFRTGRKAAKIGVPSVLGAGAVAGAVVAGLAYRKRGT